MKCWWVWDIMLGETWGSIYTTRGALRGVQCRGRNLPNCHRDIRCLSSGPVHYGDVAPPSWSPHSAPFQEFQVRHPFGVRRFLICCFELFFNLVSPHYDTNGKKGKGSNIHLASISSRFLNGTCWLAKMEKPLSLPITCIPSKQQKCYLLLLNSISMSCQHGIAFPRDPRTIDLAISYRHVICHHPAKRSACLRFKTVL